MVVDENDRYVAGKTAFRMAGVCRAWRRLLLNYGPAWSHIWLQHPSIVELMIRRSKTADIALVVDLKRTRTAETQLGHQMFVQMACHCLSEVPSRIKTLAMMSRDRGISHEVISMISDPKLKLESLELCAFDNENACIYFLTPTHLKESMPLKRLVLQNTRFSSGAAAMLPAHCSALRHLQLHADRGMSLRSLLDVLFVARNTLQTIMLESLPLLAPVEEQAKVVYLPNLLDISLKGLYPSTDHKVPIVVLSHVSYRPETHVTIHVHLTQAVLGAAAEDYTHLPFSSRYSSFQSGLISSIKKKTQLGLRIRYWPCRGVPDILHLDQRPPAPLDLRVTRRIDVPEEAVVSALCALAKSTSARDVRWLAAAPIRAESPWARILVLCPHLEELSIYGPTSLRNLECARTGNNHGLQYTASDLGSQSKTLESLRTLNVFGLSISPSLEHYTSSMASSDYSVLMSLLMSLPRTFVELCVCYCDTRGLYMDSLAASIVDRCRIIWDGSVNGASCLPMDILPPLISPRADDDITGSQH